MRNSLIALLLALASGNAQAWSYHQSTDEMRGVEINSARIHSENQAAVNHGRSLATLVVRDWPGEGGEAVLVHVSRSVLDCSRRRPCEMAAKFDDGEVLSYRLTQSDNPDWAFIDNHQAFLSRLKGAQRLIIEVPVYRSGKPQFKFDIEGLEWPRNFDAEAL